MAVGNTIGASDWQAGFDPMPYPGYAIRMQPWFVYLLRCADTSLYCGITTDIERRVEQHNAGTASKYTRPRRPVELAALVEVADKSTALKLEIQVKKQPRNKKQPFLLAYTPAQP